MIRAALAKATGKAIALLARLITAVRGVWEGVEPRPRQRIYFANHCSHGDFVLIWTVLPATLRRSTRPVAGADYWLGTAVRRFVIRDVFRAVLIERDPDKRTEDPVEQMVRALNQGASLIVFPEGTRKTVDTPLLPFKTGLFHLANARPEIDLVPVWIENLNRVMPKGEILPVPIVCTVTFGAPLRLHPEEARDAFLARASKALLETAAMTGHAA
ncbi:MAG: lysophospholipid acyltransferase family protein [Pseudomonadota bacterium]